MNTVRLTGIGLYIEDAQRPLWSDLHKMMAGHPTIRGLASEELAEAHELVPAKERRILSDEDVIGIVAADLACRDASPTFADDAACIVLNTGKHTVVGERKTYRRQFMTPQATLDGLAMAQAVERGEAQINPFSLLRTLDNNVLWWLCRYRNFGAINLQLTQRMTPSFFALWEAVELLREGSASQVLVGGTQTIEQAAVDRTHETKGFVSAGDQVVGGGALFFVLERKDAAIARNRQGYADLTLESASSANAADIVYDRDVGARSGGRAPGIASFVALLEAVLHGRTVQLRGAHADAAVIRVVPTRGRDD